MEKRDGGRKIFFRVRYQCKYPVAGSPKDFQHIEHWKDDDLPEDAAQFHTDLILGEVNLNGGELVGTPSLRKVFGEYEEAVDAIYEKVE